MKRMIKTKSGKEITMDQSDMIDSLVDVKHKMAFLTEVALVAAIYDIREFTNEDCKNGYHTLVREAQECMQEFQDNLEAFFEGVA